MLLFLLALQIPVISDSMLSDWRPDSVFAYDSIPTVYHKWWKEIQGCVGMKNLKMNKINWFEVRSFPGHVGFPCPKVRYCLGWWKAKGQEIFILKRHVMDEYTIKHEMLHQILWAKNIDRTFMHHSEHFNQCGL